MSSINKPINIENVISDMDGLRNALLDIYGKKAQNKK